MALKDLEKFLNKIKQLNQIAELINNSPKKKRGISTM